MLIVYLRQHSCCRASSASRGIAALPSAVSPSVSSGGESGRFPENKRPSNTSAAFRHNVTRWGQSREEELQQGAAEQGNKSQLSLPNVGMFYHPVEDRHRGASTALRMTLSRESAQTSRDDCGG